ncbi:MAG: LPS assembly protein LptD [Gammaproteobacteria bacterium]|nr:LPS assembly protein LptD [Gammaproteobacteria bacterium]
MGDDRILRFGHQFVWFCLGIGLFSSSFAASESVDVVKACVITSKSSWDASHRAQIASCLGWQDASMNTMCHGSYQMTPRFSQSSGEHARLIQVRADNVSFVSAGRSKLSGHVEVQHEERIVSAETAYLYRDPKTQHVTEVELLENVIYVEPGRFMRAHRVKLNPLDKSGTIDNALYRFEHKHAHASLPAFGKADLIQRFKNRDLLLKGATYTTCSPKDNAWALRAAEIRLYDDEGRAVVHDAVLEFRDTPIVYTPYLSFPTSKARKSGFLMPTSGYSNIGGGDISFPYYWNIAPNYDATILPHVYTRRGLMLGGDTRFMTAHSNGVLGGNFLARDRAFKEYLAVHQASYPQLRGVSDNRWSVFFRETTMFTDRLKLDINYQKISDDYFLQDFNNNMTVMTESQLLQEGALTYTGDHWFARGMVQGYQTLNPINQSPVDYIYQRLPQIQVRGDYADLPLNANFTVRAQYDLFHWPVNDATKLEGPRYHVNPELSFDYRKSWGYITPEVQVVENHYNLHTENSVYSPNFNHTIPRYSTDAGLTFERKATWDGGRYTQTFEPRLYYLYVPYQNQSNIPAFDSAYMIFRYEQLFRTNRFSGFDRISDGNQLAYAFRTRLLSEDDGKEKMSFSVGQLRYFSDRRVQLCYAIDGQCTDDSRMLGFTSSESKSSPIATVFTYNLGPVWSLSGSWSFDVFQNATDNADMSMKYEPEKNHILRFMYSYLVDANLIEQLDGSEKLAAEHQATVAYAWPLSEHWSSVGVYSYNISERYDMVSFLGLQYESCCWAVRAFAGRAFNSLNLDREGSQYNNSVYIQLLLKGLGSVSSNDPATTIRTYLPTYKDLFHH